MIHVTHMTLTSSETATELQSLPLAQSPPKNDRPVDIDVGFPAMPAPVPPLSLVNAGTPTPNKGEELTPRGKTRAQQVTPRFSPRVADWGQQYMTAQERLTSPRAVYVTNETMTPRQFVGGFHPQGTPVRRVARSLMPARGNPYASPSTFFGHLPW